MISPSQAPAGSAAQSLTGQQPAPGALESLLAAMAGSGPKSGAPAGNFEGLFQRPGKSLPAEGSSEQTLAAAQAAAAQGLTAPVAPTLPQASLPNGSAAIDDGTSAGDSSTASTAGSLWATSPAQPSTVAPRGFAFTTKPQALAATAAASPASAQGVIAGRITRAAAVIEPSAAPASPAGTYGFFRAASPTRAAAGSSTPPTQAAPSALPASPATGGLTAATELESGQSLSGPTNHAKSAASTTADGPNPATPPAQTRAMSAPVAGRQTSIPLPAAVPSSRADSPATSVSTQSAMVSTPTVAAAAPTAPQAGTFQAQTVAPESDPAESGDSSSPSGQRVPAKIARSASTRSTAVAGLTASAENASTTNLSSSTNKPYQPVGTDAAKSAVTMSASTLSARSNPIEMEKKTHSFALGADHSAQDSSGALPAEPTAAARQVLGTLLKVIDQADKPERSQVELKFDFGQETLAVRVAMKGGEVHTVFQTSSHELRVHLAQQWHDFTSQLPESARTQPDPVFTHSSSSSLHWSHQDASSGRHHSDTSREPAFTTSAPSGDAPEGDEIATARPAPLPRGQSLLNTLA